MRLVVTGIGVVAAVVVVVGTGAPVVVADWKGDRLNNGPNGDLVVLSGCKRFR